MITRDDVQSWLDRLDGGGLTTREVEANLWIAHTPDGAEVVVHFAPPVLLLRVRVMELPGTGGQVEAAALGKTQVLLQLVPETLPDPQAVDHQRQFDRRAPLLAHPAPVAPRLFTGDATFLAQQHRDASARQKIRRCAADNSATHNHHIDARRQRRRRRAPGPLIDDAGTDLLFAVCHWRVFIDSGHTSTGHGHFHRSRIAFSAERHYACPMAAMKLEATLPSSWYRREDVFALEREHIFFKEWMCVARDEEFPAAGAHRVVDVL